MDELAGILVAAVSQGILWSIMTLGVYITFKILDYADLGVDGSFATGGAITAILITKGVNPLLSLIAAFAGGMAAGLVTGLLHTKLKIPGILAGILTMLALYSVNVRIMGQSNISLLGLQTFISDAPAFMQGLHTDIISLVFGVIFVVIVMAGMYWFFGTEVGSTIRATGNNEYMVRALGSNTDLAKIIGLVLSNGLVALSGAMVAQNQSYADVGMGTGTIVIGLASIIIGEVVMGNRFSFLYKLLAAVVGSIIYRIVIALVLWKGLQATDLKLMTSAVIAIALGLPVIKNTIVYRKKKMAQLKTEKEG